MGILQAIVQVIFFSLIFYGLYHISENTGGAHIKIDLIADLAAAQEARLAYMEENLERLKKVVEELSQWGRT